MAVFLFRQVWDRTTGIETTAGKILPFSRYEILDAGGEFDSPRLLQDWTLEGLWYLSSAPWSKNSRDFVSVSFHGEVVQWSDRGMDGFVREEVLEAPMLAASAVRTGDLTGDGIDDLAISTHELLDQASGTSGVVVYPSTADGRPGDVIVSAWPMDSTGAGKLADITGDGIFDAVAVDIESLVMIPGRGDGRFLAEARQIVEFDASSQGIAGPRLATGDFDGDGDDDVALARCGDGIVYVYLATNAQLELSQQLSVGRCAGIAGGQLVGSSEFDLAVIMPDDDELLVIAGIGEGMFSEI